MTTNHENPKQSPFEATKKKTGVINHDQSITPSKSTIRHRTNCTKTRRHRQRQQQPKQPSKTHYPTSHPHKETPNKHSFTYPSPYFTSPFYTMRSVSFVAVVFGCAVACASALDTLDCTQFNETVDASTVDLVCGGTKEAVALNTLNCDAGTVSDWLDVFTTCAVGLTGYSVFDADQSKTMCTCYKSFVQHGFSNGCQTPVNVRALALQGFRFGVGEPLLSDKLSSLIGGGSCTLAGRDATTGIYSGPGSLLTAPVSDGPSAVAQSCIPACANICTYDECAPAGSATMAGAALAMAFAAVVSLMQ
jgi:hypothetical protein